MASLGLEGGGRRARVEATALPSQSFSQSKGDVSLKKGSLGGWFVSTFADGVESAPAFFNPERGPGVVEVEVEEELVDPEAPSAAFFAACFSAQVPPVVPPPGLSGDDFTGNEELLAFGGTPEKERMVLYSVEVRFCWQHPHHLL